MKKKAVTLFIIAVVALAAVAACASDMVGYGPTGASGEITINFAGDELPAPGVVPAVAPGGDIYKIQPNDFLSIKSYPEGKLPPGVTVRPDGTITLPIIGVTQASGLTVFELSDQVVRKLKEYIRFPWVEFSVSIANEKKVRVFGEVMRPGTVTMKENFRVLDILPQIGGFTKFADTAEVRLIHTDGTESTVNIDRIMESPGSAENALLQNGDIIHIPKLEREPDTVRVIAIGNFNKQGRLDLPKERATLLDAISEAGGFTASADLKSVRVVRAGQGTSQAAGIDVEKILAGQDPGSAVAPLRDGDILYAPSVVSTKKVKKIDKANEIFKEFTPSLTVLLLMRNVTN